MDDSTIDYILRYQKRHAVADPAAQTLTFSRAHSQQNGYAFGVPILCPLSEIGGRVYC